MTRRFRRGENALFQGAAAAVTDGIGIEHDLVFPLFHPERISVQIDARKIEEHDDLIPLSVLAGIREEISVRVVGGEAIQTRPRNPLSDRARAYFCKRYSAPESFRTAFRAGDIF